MCVPDDRPDIAAGVIRAVNERAGTALAPVPVEVERPPGRYVAGEESALVSWLERWDRRAELAAGQETLL